MFPNYLPPQKISAPVVRPTTQEHVNLGVLNRGNRDPFSANKDEELEDTTNSIPLIRLDWQMLYAYEQNTGNTSITFDELSQTILDNDGKEVEVTTKLVDINKFIERYHREDRLVVLEAVFKGNLFVALIHPDGKTASFFSLPNRVQKSYLQSPEQLKQVPTGEKTRVEDPRLQQLLQKSQDPITGKDPLVKNLIPPNDQSPLELFVGPRNAEIIMERIESGNTYEIFTVGETGERQFTVSFTVLNNNVRVSIQEKRMDGSLGKEIILFFTSSTQNNKTNLPTIKTSDDLKQAMYQYQPAKA